MHRQFLLEKIADYERSHPEEAATVQRMHAFIERCPSCFERSLQEGHITGSAWLVNQAHTHVLLTHHKKLNRWFQLGGHADGDSNILAVALKEGREESGIDNIIAVSEAIFDIDIHLIPARKTEPAHYHYDVRFALTTCAAASEEYSVSEESHDLAWVPIENMLEYSDEASMLRMRNKWLQR